MPIFFLGKMFKPVISEFDLFLLLLPPVLKIKALNESTEMFMQDLLGSKLDQYLKVLADTILSTKH